MFVCVCVWLRLCFVGSYVLRGIFLCGSLHLAATRNTARFRNSQLSMADEKAKSGKKRESRKMAVHASHHKWRVDEWLLHSLEVLAICKCEEGVLVKV